MTTYDAPDGTTGPRRDNAEGNRRAGSFRSGPPDFIDGEVVAVEVHNDVNGAHHTPTPGPAASRRRAAATGEHPIVEPTGPDSAGLQDSLDHIERLAAELKEIAEVITPTPNSSGRQAAAARAAAAQDTNRRGGNQAGQQATTRPQHHAPVPPPATASVPPAATVPPSATTPAAHAAPTATGRAEAPTSARPAGPRFGAHNAPPSAAARPGAATQPAAAKSAAAEPAAGRPDDQIQSWLGPDGELKPRPASMGTSVVKEPLPPEPKRKGNPDLVFGATPPRSTTPEPTPAAAAAATAGAATSQPTAAAGSTKAAATSPRPETAGQHTAGQKAAGQGTAGQQAASQHSSSRPTAMQQAAAQVPGARAGKKTDAKTDATVRAEKVVIAGSGTATATAAIPSVFSSGSAKANEVTEAIRTTAPPSRTSRKDQRRPAGRSKAPRGRYTAMIIGAFVLAIPAFALGAVQPWNTSAKSSEDKISVATGDRATEPPTTGDEPSAAIPNPSPTPSVASVAPITPKEVSAGQAGEQPKNPPAGRPSAPKSTPPTHRKTHPVGLALSVYAANVKPYEGESVRFKLTWKDGSGHFGGTNQQWGDGSPATSSMDIKKCTGEAPASSGATEVTHTFRESGTFIVKLSVTTYTCDGRTETQTVPMKITVKKPPVTPTPTPTETTPTPTPSPKPTDGDDD